MQTHKFKVTYPGGKVTTFDTTCATVEDFCNSHFGSAWEEAKTNGASVEMVPTSFEDGGHPPLTMPETVVVTALADAPDFEPADSIGESE